MIREIVGMQRGHSYYCTGVALSYNRFIRSHSEENPTKIITVRPPKLVKSLYFQGEKPKDLSFEWISKQRDLIDFSTIDSMPEKIVHEFRKYFENSEDEDSLGVLDGIEYLVEEMSFNSYLRGLKDIVDIVSVNKKKFLMPINPDALDKKQISLFQIIGLIGLMENK